MKFISANFLRLVPARRKTHRGLTARQAQLAAVSIKSELRRRVVAPLKAPRLYTETDLLDPTAGEAPLLARRLPAAAAAAAAAPVPPKAKKRFYLRPRYDGVPDILDAIQELGGIASPAQSRHADKGDFDGFAEAMTGPARLLIRRSGGLMPDLLVHALTDAKTSTGQTFRLESTSDLYDAIAAAVQGRQADKKQAARDLVDQEFYEAALTDKPRRAGCATPVPVGQLKVGDRFKVKRDECTVRDLDPDTAQLDVRCSPRFGRQTILDGSALFPDNCRVESSNPRRRKNSGGLFDKPESVEEQKQRLADEQAHRLKTEQREELRRRAAAPITGRGVETTGDLFNIGAASAPLFATRRKNPVNAMAEWKRYNDLFNAGASRAELLKAARGMADPQNRKTALLNLGKMTTADRKRIAHRWASIEAVTEKEAAAHCQFAGLPRLKNPARKPSMIAQRLGSKIVLRRGGLKFREFASTRQFREWARLHGYRIA